MPRQSGDDRGRTRDLPAELADRATGRDLLHEVRDRLLRPLIAADGPPAPLRQALGTIDEHIGAYLNDAQMANAG
jgi:hypothetical protein